MIISSLVQKTVQSLCCFCYCWNHFNQIPHNKKKKIPLESSSENVTKSFDICESKKPSKRETYEKWKKALSHETD